MFGQTEHLLKSSDNDQETKVLHPFKLAAVYVINVPASSIRNRYVPSVIMIRQEEKTFHFLGSLIFLDGRHNFFSSYQNLSTRILINLKVFALGGAKFWSNLGQF